jgi:hypothetical protein
MSRALPARPPFAHLPETHTENSFRRAISVIAIVKQLAHS